MRHLRIASVGLAAALASTGAMAQERPFARPDLVLKQAVETLPKGDRQEIRVLTATLAPGIQTPFHTHRFPVTVYVLEGTFTLDLDGRPPLIAKAGEAIVEPPNVKMTGYNKSAIETAKVVIFYVSDPDTPFLDMAH
jgi:quercetin dioxygenase-like cupin family protein